MYNDLNYDDENIQVNFLYTEGNNVDITNNIYNFSKEQINIIENKSNNIITKLFSKDIPFKFIPSFENLEKLHDKDELYKNINNLINDLNKIIKKKLIIQTQIRNLKNNLITTTDNINNIININSNSNIKDLKELNKEMIDYFYNYLDNYKNINKTNIENLETELIELEYIFMEKYAIYTSIKNIFTKNICSICIDKSITHTIIGCGHTFCIDCINENKNECPLCRTKIIKIQKIFI